MRLGRRSASAAEQPPTRAARRRARRGRRRVLVTTAALVVLVGVIGGLLLVGTRSDEPDAVAEIANTTPPTTAVSTANPPTTAPPPFPGWVDPASVGQPYPGATVAGLLTFRGNPTRTYHGQGPVPAAPQELWRYPDEAMCSLSSDRGETTEWCGTGWTGQPAVFERDGKTWLAFGAYDRAVHFVDAATGADLLPPFPTGDIIKGTVTVDPDGFPLLYTGSRDGFFRVLAFDGGAVRELWKLSADAVSPTKWNDDWDSSPLVLDDYLFEGGENSQFHVVKLNRAYAPDGTVTVDPQLVFNAPGWDDELTAAVGGEVSIENSLAIFADTLYFANSGGLVQGWDIAGLRTGAGPPQRVFRFWTGDDTDATVVVDEEGMLYVGSEWERHNERAREVGQMMKLDPGRPDDPLVWSQRDDGAEKAGVWSTPALHGDLVIFTTFNGRGVGLDRTTGEIRWEVDLAAPVMGSPVVVDGIWVQGDCSGQLRAFDVRDTAVVPTELWSVTLGGCIESTPAVWKGRAYVGTRAGYVHAVGDG